MKKIYFIPSVHSQDFSIFQFFKNQGTCDPATILNGEELQRFDDFPTAPCGFGQFDAANSIGFCLSGTVPVDQLIGLTVFLSDNTSFEILSCEIDVFPGCDDFGGTFYDCSVNGAPSDLCVTHIECPDGTLITQCNNDGGGCSL
jgi:hypothetical protein